LDLQAVDPTVDRDIKPENIMPQPVFQITPLFERDPFLNRIRTSPQFVQLMSEQKAQWEKLQQEFDN
jgi:hypothetical protein